MTIDSLLRQCDEDIPRPCNLVDARNRFRAVGHGSNRLCSADLVNLRHTCDLRCKKHIGIDLAIFRRHHHDDLAYPRDSGRHGIHENGRGIRCRSARHIDACSVKRYERLTENRSFLAIRQPRICLLLFVIPTNIVCRPLQRRDNRWISSPCRLSKFFLRHLKIFRRKICSVDELRVLDDGFITRTPHVFDDAPNDFCRRKIRTKNRLVCFADLRIQLHFIEWRLRQKFSHFALAEFSCCYDPHDFAPPLSNTLHKSSIKR